MDLSRRGGPVAAVAALVVMLVAGVLLLNGPGGVAGTDASAPNPSLTRVPTTPPDLAAPARGPAPPSSGAWVGAWVKPDVPTQAGRVAAVARFEREIGRPLDIVQTYHSTEDFPADADLDFVQQGKTLMISWSGDDTRVIVSGRDDALIRARAQGIKAMGVPLMLRWRFEMNRPNLQASVWSPNDFVAAWKHVRAIFTAVGATNAAFVWCPLATDFDATQGPAYYPGDDQVEWICTDVYPGPDYSSFADVAGPFMMWASTHAKPVIIGEYGAEDKDGGNQAQWIADAGTYAKAHPQIKAMVYFEAESANNGKSRNYTISGTGAPLQAFRSMALQPYFYKRGGG
jgi:hypothetical protein